MAVLDARKTRNSLTKKGFKIREGGDRYFEYWHNGRVVTRTFMSHNDQELNNWLIGQMSKQCQLNKSEFLRLIECPLTEDQYVRILTEKGVI